MIYLGIFVILIIVLQIFLTLNIKIEIEDLKITLPTINKKTINNESKIKIKFYLLKIIKIKEIDLKKIKTDDKKVQNRINKLKSKMIMGNSGFKYNAKVIEILKEDNYNLEKFNLNIYLGTEDAALTAILVGIVSSLIGFILKRKITNIDVQNFFVNPVYQNKNMLKINFDGIFSLNITNIIDIIKILRKGRVNKNDRSSYRRTYAYSNE